MSLGLRNFKGLEEASRVWYFYIIHLISSYYVNDIHSNDNDIHNNLLSGCGLLLISSMESWNLCRCHVKMETMRQHNIMKRP